MTTTAIPPHRSDSGARLPAPSHTRRFLYVRLGFALIWAVDATLKWLPGFRDGFASMVDGAAQGQPPWLRWWFDFWTRLLGHAPTAFAVLTALAETAILLCLVFGVLQRLGWAFGIVFGLLIWGVGEGFGGPYGSGATDIGCAVIYSALFLALWVAVPAEVRRGAPALDHRLAAYRSLRWATFS